MDTAYFIIHSVFAAIVAYVYAVILTKPGMLLSGLYKFIEKHIGKYEWLFNPIIGCYICVSGWSGIFFYLYYYYNSYNLIENITFVSLTIFLVYLIDKIHRFALD